MTGLDLFTRGDAVISDDGLYRYLLTRVWDEERGSVLYVMLNPSTADACDDDATLRRCRAFAQGWGYGEIRVVNLFAYRATKPKELKVVADPVGPKNDHMLASEFNRAWSLRMPVVCAWGAAPVVRLNDRADRVLAMMQAARLDPMCIVETKTGYPMHPLYIRSTEQLRKYERRKGDDV